MYCDIKQDLIGRKIESISLDAAKDRLTVVAGGLTFNYEVTGDCCSTSWIEHLEGAENVVGKEVLDVQQLSENGGDAAKKHCERCGESDILEVNQILIKTANATATLEFHNDSNGYYGGSIKRA